MKQLTYAAVGAALLLVPIAALAETGAPAPTESATAPIEKPPFPRLGPVIKQTIENSREGVQNAASTTREIVKDRVDAVHTLIDIHKNDVRAMLERKRMGKMASTTEQIQEKRKEMRQKLEEKKETVANRIEAAKEKAQEKYSEAVQRSVGNIADRLAKALERLTELASRLDTRISEHQNDGKDMSVSVSFLTEARTDIAVAQDAVTAVGTTLSAALASTSPKGEMGKVRSAVKTAEDAIKKAKESLHKTLESVREEATSTPETITN